MTDQTILKETPSPSVPPQGRAPEVKAAPPHSGRPSPRSLIVGALIAVVAGVGFYFYVPGFWLVSTDDAYVNAHVVSIVPKVAAYVLKLHVNDNSKVARDELLIQLDPRDFQVAVDIANADLKSAQASAANIGAQIREQQSIVAESQSAIDGDQALLDFALQQLDRYKSLASTGSGTVERLQQVEADVGQRRATVQHDQAAHDAARAHQAVLETQELQAKATLERQQAALAQAQLNLSYTKISAAEAGSVANKTVEEGNYVQPGQVLLSIVPDTLYITANFKETQLTDVRPGQRATIRVDAFPGLRLEGRVDSLQRGTGSQFALLPPENATGNFVKVVQRVPVKITFNDPGEAVHWISPGMSVEARIYTADPPAWLGLLD
ncbi:HlyD family secretion protein [Bradyrhizobium sp.]|jgi:membrane fusion protein (multidrug efflux system)|uniref:HlyD family secretion protein n=1 Tax=Bradyrhizobium sp. TaxID=376 RepID=UPI003C237F1B